MRVTERWRRAAMLSGNNVGIVDFKPVRVGVLEVDLPNPVWACDDIPRLPGGADIRHPVLLRAGDRRLDILGRECHMGGERVGSFLFKVAANQAEGPGAVDGETSGDHSCPRHRSNCSSNQTLAFETGVAEYPRLPPAPHHRPKQGPPNTERMQGDPPRLLPEDVTVIPP